MIRKFDDDRSNPSTALKVYLILIGNAVRGQITTYTKLAQQLYGSNAQHVMADRLTPIYFWCQQNDLPPLTSIVVGDDGHKAERAFLAREDVPAKQQEVFRFDWYSVHPPTVDELREAVDTGRNAA
jgi:hypothetical protein